MTDYAHERRVSRLRILLVLSCRADVYLLCYPPRVRYRFLSILLLFVLSFFCMVLCCSSCSRFFFFFLLVRRAGLCVGKHLLSRQVVLLASCGALHVAGDVPFLAYAEACPAASLFNHPLQISDMQSRRSSVQSLPETSAHRSIRGRSLAVLLFFVSSR